MANARTIRSRITPWTLCVTRVFKRRVRRFWTSLELQLGKHLLAIAPPQPSCPPAAGLGWGFSGGASLTHIMRRAEAGFPDREMCIEMGGVGTGMEMVAPGRADVGVGMANGKANGKTGTAARCQLIRMPTRTLASPEGTAGIKDAPAERRRASARR